MADEIYYGPIKLFESEASKARKEAELNKELLDLQSKQLDVQNKMMQNPDYQIRRAGELAQRSLEMEQQLSSQSGLVERLGKKAEGVREAALPPPRNLPNTIMPADMALALGQKLIEDQDLARARVARIGGELETIRKQREGLQGSVNLGEFMGTAPAGDVESIARRRVQENTRMLGELNSYVKNSATPEEAEIKMAAAKEIKPWFNMQAKRELDNTLKVQGLGGMAKDEKAAIDIRDRAPQMVNTVAAVRSLMTLADEADRLRSEIPRGNIAAIKQLRVIQERADLIRAPLIGNLNKPLLGGGPITEQERAYLEQAIQNPTGFISIFARERLMELERIVKKDFVGRARISGYEVNSLQPVFDAYSEPADFNQAAPKMMPGYLQSEVDRKNEQEQPRPMVERYDSEASARAAGKRDYDYANIGGRIVQILPD